MGRPAKSETMTQFRRGWVPFPNVLIDLYMPKLTDSEWRLLTVICRQTLGWQQFGSKKRRAFDRLSHAQLKRKTGRQSAAISAAIKSLQSKGLILIFDRDGNPAATPSYRRQLHDSLYFGLAPAVHSYSTTGVDFTKSRNSDYKNNNINNPRNIKESGFSPGDDFG